MQVTRVKGLMRLVVALLIAYMNAYRACGMGQYAHTHGMGELGGALDLRGTPVGQGGAGNMTMDKIDSIGAWMDNPAQKTGKYRNWNAGGRLVHPNNHNALRHNPEKVAHALSGKGVINEGVQNVARVHKIGDIYINHVPVDGWEVTPQRKKEAEVILRYVRRYKKLPTRLPEWVDAPGPLITCGKKKAVNAAVQSAGEATKAGTKAKIVRGAGRVVTVAAVVVEGAVVVNRIIDTEEAYAEGTLSAQERGARHAEAVGGAIGGTLGGYAGATAGAAGGAVLGSLAGPAGTVGGGVGGGVVGGMVGGYAGDKVGRMIGRSTVGRALGTMYVIEEDAVTLANVQYLNCNEELTLPAAAYEGIGLSRAELRALRSTKSRENDVKGVNSTSNNQ